MVTSSPCKRWSVGGRCEGKRRASWACLPKRMASEREEAGRMAEKGARLVCLVVSNCRRRSASLWVLLDRRRS